MWRHEDGLSLVEALVAIFVLTMVATSLGQMIGLGMMSNKNARDLTTATSLSTSKLEELRSGDYVNLVAGGDLASDASGYFEMLDVDDDGTNDFNRRWRVTDQTGGKTVEVRVIGLTDSIGPVREATMATVVSER